MSPITLVKTSLKIARVPYDPLQNFLQNGHVVPYDPVPYDPLPLYFLIETSMIIDCYFVAVMT